MVVIRVLDLLLIRGLILHVLVELLVVRVLVTLMVEGAIQLQTVPDVVPVLQKWHVQTVLMVGDVVDLVDQT